MRLTKYTCKGWLNHALVITIPKSHWVKTTLKLLVWGALLYVVLTLGLRLVEQPLYRSLPVVTKRRKIWRVSHGHLNALSRKEAINSIYCSWAELILAATRGQRCNSTCAQRQRTWTTCWGNLITNGKAAFILCLLPWYEIRIYIFHHFLWVRYYVSGLYILPHNSYNKPERENLLLVCIDEKTEVKCV